MLKSAQRLSLPSFDTKEALECIKKYILMEKSWIPSQKGYTLYIRPTIIGAQEWLGVGPSNRAIFFVICSPVGPYYRPTGFAPVSLWAEDKFVRAWPGGMGQYKVGGNYAPGILPQVQVAEKGYQQILWLFGPDKELTEVGTMNLFVFWKRPSDGKKELITASLKDGTILPGVTRDSILKLTQQWGEFEVTEGRITMSQIIESLRKGTLLEMFGAGTAAIVSPVKNIYFQGKDYVIPLDQDDPNALAGPLARRIWKTLSDIQYGDLEHEWSMVLK
jgi:branched-chain amino acid aminotransferase